MQSFSSRIWTRVTVSISYDDNDYTTKVLGYWAGGNIRGRLILNFEAVYAHFAAISFGKTWIHVFFFTKHSPYRRGLKYDDYIPFRQWSGRPGFNPRSRHTRRLLKWYLIPPCLTLSNVRYISRVKWSNPEKGVVPSPTHRCISYWKESFLVALNYGRQLYLLYLYPLQRVNIFKSGVSRVWEYTAFGGEAAILELWGV